MAILVANKSTYSYFNLTLTGKQIVLGGDARCDSPGYSAKYGSYSLMDLETNKILDIQLVQVVMNRNIS